MNETQERIAGTRSFGRLIGRMLTGALLMVTVSAAPLVHAQDSTPTSQETPVPTRCTDGQLRVGDIQFLDEEWAKQQPNLNARAQEWESDAVLTKLRVNCGILEPGFRWRGTYYSPSQQAFFETDSGNAFGAEFDPEDARALPNELKFGAVWRALIKAGYTDATTLTAAIGISLQVNSEAMPLGPGEVPVGATVCHVGLEHGGGVRDLFINVDDGTVFRHTFG
jgi:hypothetical protein